MLNTSNGALELIMGCMFSGKSTELLRRIRMHRMLGRNVTVIKHAIDNRYGNGLKVCSHDMDEEPAMVLDNLMSYTHNSCFAKANVICIDEGQFFDDIEEFVRLAVDTLKKHVIVSGLDGTFERKPFKNMVNLISMADHYVKLNALCTICKNGTPASFSRRLINDTAETLIGGSDKYISVCRHHFADVGCL